MIKWDRSKGRPEPIQALNRIPELENGEPLVDLRQAAPTLLFPRETTIPYARESVARMAAEAAASLPNGYRLAVTDAWRPFLRQQLIYEYMWKCGEEAFPNLTYAQMRRRINRWVAPFDQKAPPGHCTGAALDVILTTEDGTEVDVYSPFTRFKAAPTFSYGLDPEPARHRMMLYEAMTGAGFSNCRDEWWHYSYGDAGWAVRLELPTCFYGLIELDESLYLDQQRIWLEALHGRPNPFLHG